MSQYIEFYIKKSEFTLIGNFTRSSKIFKILGEFVPCYSVVSPLSVTQLNLARENARTEIEIYRNNIKDLEKQINIIGTFNNSISEKMDLINDINHDIRLYKEEIEELSQTINYFNFLNYIIEYNEEGILYCGIECELPEGEN